MKRTSPHIETLCPEHMGRMELIREVDKLRTENDALRQTIKVAYRHLTNTSNLEGKRRNLMWVDEAIRTLIDALA